MDDCIQQKSKILRNQKISSTTNVVSEHASKACIFCKIIKGELPCSKLYENEKVFAFLDFGPVNKGHSLVIPKEHYETLLDIPDELLKDVSIIVKKISVAVKKAVNADGISIGQSNFKAAGQVVPHIHFHIMPRFDDDGLKLWPQGKYDEGEIESYKEKIIKELIKISQKSPHFS